ncbi:double zinc ribbon domain-containing protein [Anaerosolibacter sp.]|uniref:double zinc ribbon domain-containing protein n=1 Tax=Anaerosolibacter sp. TaxID=1872527 RepID=UPI0039F0FA7B
MMLIGIIFLGLIVYLFYFEGSSKCSCSTENMQDRCYNCGHLIKDDFIYCPQCKVGLKEKCKGCNKLINIAWRSCPYCNTPNVE